MMDISRFVEPHSKGKSQIQVFAINLVHSPIVLKHQRVKILQCASIEVSDKIQVICSDYSHVPGETAKEEDNLPPKTPTNLYHPAILDFDSPYSKNEFGTIAGLSSTLKISTTTSFLTTVNVNGDDNDTNVESVITINDEKSFSPGSIVLYRTWPVGTSINETNGLVRHISDVSIHKDASPMEKLWCLLGMNDKPFVIELMSKLGADVLSSGIPWAERNFFPGLLASIKPIKAIGLNVALYRCESEDRDTIGDGLYDIPGYGKLVYGGLQGLASVLIPACRENNLGHPLFENLRRGPWLCSYIINRLEKYVNLKYSNLSSFKNWLQARLELIQMLPPSYIPKYFALLIINAYQGLRLHGIYLINGSKIQKPITVPSSLDVFAYSCRLTTYQFYASINSAGLIPVPFTMPLLYETEVTPVWNSNGVKIGSFSAGLPHFTTEYARVWGRDVFISLRGLMLLPGHYEIARSHLVAFASTLKHGLLPNLLDHGRYPRYNARDAVWFFLSSVVDYCLESPEGKGFLDAPVARRFLPWKRYREPGFGFDDSGQVDADEYLEPNDESVYQYTSTIAQICFEILERHYNGISFRERNAGAQLDHAMSDQGFNIDIKVKDDGFIYGGNKFNCGTWMDKMGDSFESGNRGKPSTPRDGAAIEIAGLQSKFLNFVVELIRDNDPKWPYLYVRKYQSEEYLTIENWKDTIDQNFEKTFYNEELGYYRDVVGCQQSFQEDQLRPNQLVAMFHAPKLFDPAHVKSALNIIKDNLVGKLGKL
jgi:glycogen debranching enzyme